MSYEKQTWVCGETITADKLNHIEEGIENCCGSADLGYECDEEWVTLTEEAVTTAQDGDTVDGQLSYSETITADTIKVTFNGTEYICEKTELDNGSAYGASYDDSLDSMDWSDYPFSIFSGKGVSFLETETAGTYNIKIETYEDVITTTPCFDKARGYSCSSGTTILTSETIDAVLDNK